MANETAETQRKEPKVGEALRGLKQNASDLGMAVSLRRYELGDKLTAFVQERPLAAVGAALGIGYVLGGGLFSKTTGRLLSIGLRIGAAMLTRDLLGGVEVEQRP